MLIEEVLKTFGTAKRGSQDSRKQLPESVWTTHKATEELFSERHKGRISYVTGWIHTIHVKHRGPSVGNGLLWRNGLRLKTLLALLGQAKQSRASDEELPPFYAGELN